MMKTKVGYSENVDAFSSGVETATMANVITILKQDYYLLVVFKTKVKL